MKILDEVRYDIFRRVLAASVAWCRETITNEQHIRYSEMLMHDSIQRMERLEIVGDVAAEKEVRAFEEKIDTTKGHHKVEHGGYRLPYSQTTRTCLQAEARILELEGKLAEVSQGY